MFRLCWIAVLMVGCAEPVVNSLCEGTGTNGWSASGTPPTVRESDVGWEVGQIPPDLRTVDQFGDETCLWPFAGQHVLIEVAALWSAPSRYIASSCRADAFGDEFVHLTVLTGGSTVGVPATVDDATAWASAFGLDQGTSQTPVVLDAVYSWTESLLEPIVPKFALLGPDLRVIRTGVGEEALHEMTTLVATALDVPTPACD